MGRRIWGLPWCLGVMLLAGCEVFEQTNTATGPPPSEIASRKPMPAVAACLTERWGTAFPNLVVAPAGQGLRVSVSRRENAFLFEAEVQPKGTGSVIIFANLTATDDSLVGQAVRDARLCAR
ncbi:MAG: hypothetical protein JNM20_00765 [Rhizobiales bacterium]|nr:hypothetical protein [Hyphomicrobiales bacterium]